MSEDSNSTTDSDGSGNMESDSPESPASSASFESDGSKGVIDNFKDEPSSPTPEPQRPDCPDVRMSERDNTSRYATPILEQQRPDYPYFRTFEENIQSPGIDTPQDESESESDVGAGSSSTGDRYAWEDISSTESVGSGNMEDESESDVGAGSSSTRRQLIIDCLFRMSKMDPTKRRRWENKKSIASKESSDSDNSKEENLNFKDEQFSPIPGQQIPFSSYYSIPHVNTSSTESVGSRIMIPVQQRPDCPDVRMPERQRQAPPYSSPPSLYADSADCIRPPSLMGDPYAWVNTSSTDRFGSGNMEWRSRKSATSGEAFKSDRSKGKTIDDVPVIKDAQSSPIPEQQRPDSPDLRMPEESNWLTESLELWVTMKPGRDHSIPINEDF